MLRTSFGLHTWCILPRDKSVMTATLIADRDMEILLRAGKFTRSFQCLLNCIGCGNVIAWIRTERNFSQWTDSTNNYGQGLSSLTLRLCTLFRNMKCDKCVGMECLELHMLDLWTPRPDILHMKSSAFTVTLHAKDVTKLPNWCCCLFIALWCAW